MADATTSAAGSWGDVLLRGVNAVIDSQAQKAYLQNEAKYNTQGGTAGQSQGTAAILQASPVILIGGALLLGVVIFLLARR